MNSDTTRTSSAPHPPKLYVFQATDPTGSSVVKEISAENISEARARLLGDGFKDLEVLEDDVMAVANAAFREPTRFLGEDIRVTAADRAEVRHKPPATFLTIVPEILVQEKGLYLLAAALLAYQGYRGYWIGFTLTATAAGAWLAFRIWLGLPMIYFGKLNEARDWQRWDEVIHWVDRNEQLRRFHFIRIPLSELLKSRAQASVGAGRLSEGLALLRQCESQFDWPDWLAKSLQGELHALAGQYDKALELQLEAIRANPITTLYLDLANTYLRHFRDTVRAREAMSRVEEESIPKMIRFYVHRCRGLLAYLEGDIGTARKELEKSLEMVRAEKGLVGRTGSMCMLKAFLACVYARQGDRRVAKKFFTEAKDYLIATKENKLIRECEELISS